MNNIFQQSTVNAIVFKLQVILLIMEGIEKSKIAIIHLAIGVHSQVINHVLAKEVSK